ncbi:MAG: hypothetical protein ABEJ57_06515 [Halobacteriaceae archaeon]
MDVPDRVADALDGEQVAASVDLGGEDTLYVTPTRTLIYRGQGFLSDDSVVEHAHDADRVTVDIGRRRATIRLDYGIDGDSEFSVPADVVDEVLHPVLAGVLNATGVTDPGETVLSTHRFSELTLIVTSHRVAKHVGEAVWNPEYEEVEYADVTALALEEGNVADQLVIETDDRTHRTKVPQQEAPRVHDRIEDALCEYHGVADYAAFERMIADRGTGAPEEGSTGSGFVDSGLDPIETQGADAADAKPASTQTKAPAEEGTTTEDADDFGAFEQATDPEADLEARLHELEATIEEQEALIAEQREALEALVATLNRRDR